MPPELHIVKKIPRKYRFFLQITSILFGGLLQAQTPADTLPVPANRLRQISADTLPPRTADSIAVDSAVVDFNKVKISKEGLDDIVEYGARDSMWFDVKNKRLHLYGQATVKYTSLDIQAGYILLDYAKNEVLAESFPDTSGTLTGYPKFKSADQEFEANRLRFNFKTKKGIIYEARTKQEDLYILGERSKFVGTPTGDSTNSQRNTIFNENSLLTTCDLPHPHYGIRAKKLKVIPDVMVITGPAHLELGGVPTPLVLPFGFFPISKNRRAGLIIPSDFEFARIEGLGIKDFGWYQPISEHMDAKALFNVYTSGSWGASGTLRYDHKYHYSGNFFMNYNTRVSEDNFANKIKNKSFGVNWTHQQDPKANPTRRFGGTVHIETNRNQNRNRNDYLSVYQNTLSSNLNYTQSFPGKPFNLTAGMSHSQNTQTREMTISFPNVNFTMQRVYPFKRKESDGTEERWYEKLSLTYNSALQNTVRVPDTLLFTETTLRNARIGIQHRASTDYNFKVFKYINIAPRINYEENWYPYTINRALLREDSLVYDTIEQEGQRFIVLDTASSRFGKVVTTRNYGFKTFRTFDAGASVNTTLFFTQQFKRGWFKGFRHKITPSVSIGVGPDFTQQRYQRYFDTYGTDSRGVGYGDTLRYSVYDDGIFGRPSYNPRQVALGYSLGNVLEFKHRVRNDSTGVARPDKKVTLFNNLTFSGNYSLTADTLRWSLVTTGGSFRLLKGITNINWGVSFDPYISDAKGRRINKFALQQQRKLVRLTNLNFQFNTGFTVSQIRKALEKKGSSSTTPAVHDDLIGWFDNFRVSHNISFTRRLIPTGYGTTRDTLVVSGNNIGINGSIQLNSKWAIDLNNISYDLVSKRIVYPDLGITRDLHCWQMSLSWQPTRGTYFFTINVKPGTLEFLKLPYQKNIFDARL